MTHCNRCKVDIHGSTDICPLCGGRLCGNADEKEDIFPRPYTPSRKMLLLLKFSIFISIAAVVAAFAVNAIVSPKTWWAWFVAGGVGCFWLTASVAVSKRDDLSRSLKWLLIVCSILTVAWDFFTGWRGWSLDYVFPIFCAGVQLGQTTLAQVFQIDPERYLIHLMWDCLIGLLPLAFLWSGLLSEQVPSIVCVAVSVLTMVAMFIFYGPVLKREIQRRLHF